MDKTWFEDYVESPNKIEAIIKYVFKLPVIIENFNFDEHPYHIRQENQRVSVSFHKILSKKLLEDVKGFYNGGDYQNIPDVLLKRNPSQYIVAYIKETLPWINEEIIKRKYNEGHIILKTISLFDVEAVFIYDNIEKKPYPILWPLLLPKFTALKEYIKSPNVTYIRDLISSMTEFFYYDLDECIRKVITSLENYLNYYQLSSSSSVVYPDNIGSSGFLKRVYSHLNNQYYDCGTEDLNVLWENILLIYGTRCKIVHNNSRLKPNNIMFCQKAIVTLTKIYQSKLIKNDNKFDYIFSFYEQFEDVITMITGINLDDLEKATKTTYNPSNIRSAISGLKITEKINFYEEVM